jgi:hypothetical protein
MAQKHLTEFSHAKAKTSEKTEVQALPFVQAVAKEKEKRVFPPVAPENLPPSCFVLATYDGKTRKALIKLYEMVECTFYVPYDSLI